VEATFRDNQRPLPFVDGYGDRFKLLQRQLKNYTQSDPPPKPQKAVTGVVIREVHKLALTDFDTHVADLIGGAFFFACRSCEYSEVTGERKTKVITLGNIQFFRRKRLIPHHSPELRYADSVAITFVLQKNDQRYEPITQHRTKDSVLCPVRRWANVVQRLRRSPGSSDSTPVNYWFDKASNKYVKVHSKQICLALRAAASNIGQDRLGYSPKELGTHSIRSGAAMTMYLSRLPVFTIMLIGRWSSDAFLRYIRHQVSEFTSGVSDQMIQADEFFHVPQVIDPEDPRTSSYQRDHSSHGRGILRIPTGRAAARFASYALSL
jgi:hypothetical protein